MEYLERGSTRKTIDSFRRSIGRSREHLNEITFGKGTGLLLNKTTDLCIYVF